jgi:hypothetical protein
MHFRTHIDINYFYCLYTRNSFLKLCRVVLKHPVLTVSSRDFFDVFYEVVKKHVERRVCPSVVKYRWLKRRTGLFAIQ